MEIRLSFRNRNEFRKWLETHYGQTTSIWIEFYKDGRKGIKYKETLEEALSFGWIDSLIKKVDEKIYIRKFSKRSQESKWSELNKKIVGELIKKGLMTKYGEEAIKQAKRNGQWDKQDEREEYLDVEALRNILIGKIKNINDFDELSDSLKKHYSLAYFVARKTETRSKRLGMIIEYMKTKKRFL
jgi:uncharacterized protein YdeI (YjbR/CyaY-like superfamily)